MLLSWICVVALFSVTSALVVTEPCCSTYDHVPVSFTPTPRARTATRLATARTAPNAKHKKEAPTPLSPAHHSRRGDPL